MSDEIAPWWTYRADVSESSTHDVGVVDGDTLDPETQEQIEQFKDHCHVYTIEAALDRLDPEVADE